MSSNLKVLQVIPKLGYGGAETGCYDIAHYLPENGCKSFLVTSGGELLKFVDKNKVKVFRLPVQTKNPILILINALILTFDASSVLFPIRGVAERNFACLASFNPSSSVAVTKTPS